MGAWAYCVRCDAPLDTPTVRQLFDREQRCPNGHLNEPKGSLGDAIADLEAKVDFLMALAAEAGRYPE